MSKTILVTGGAGFIGSHLVDKLIDSKNYNISILDNLEQQVHSNSKNAPDYLNKDAKFYLNSTVNYEKLEELVKENEIIFHLGSTVGVGQSMYQILKYVNGNILGTANLLDILVNSEHSVKKLVIASSNTVYGEGKYNCGKCGIFYPNLRSLVQLKNHQWEIICPICGERATPQLTDENTPFNASSIYAFTKQAQEQMSMLIGKTYGIDVTVLRFFLVYGQRQSLSNPYTGVCGIFSSRLLNNQPAIVFEDGLQSRDFIHVNDVCNAMILSMEKKSASGQIFNVGTGKTITIKNVAETITEKLNPSLKPIYNQKYRVGDIRHCVADITKIKNSLGFHPSIEFNDGIDDLISWISEEKENVKDKSQIALNELKKKGLLR